MDVGNLIRLKRQQTLSLRKTTGREEYVLEAGTFAIVLTRPNMDKPNPYAQVMTPYGRLLVFVNNVEVVA